MDTQFKLYIISKSLYREVELVPSMNRLKIGTSTDCGVRLRPDLFFEPFSIELGRNEKGWLLNCSDNIYISLGDVRKLFNKTLEHGDKVSIRYQNSDNELFTVYFSIDFEKEQKKFNTCVDLSDISQISIGSSADCDITLSSEYIQNESFVLKRTGTRLILPKDNTHYGVYVNGTRIEKDTELKNNDFISLADCMFCYDDNHLYTDGGGHIRFNTLKAISIEESVSHMTYPMFNRNTRVHQKIDNTPITILDPSTAAEKPNVNLVTQLLPAVSSLLVTVLLRGVLMNNGNSSSSSMVIMSAITMSVGIFTTIYSMIEENKKYKKSVKKRKEEYDSYIEKKEKEIEGFRNDERLKLEEMYYSLKKEEELVDGFKAGLFDRDHEDEDFLTLRLGSGPVEAQKKIDYKKRETFGGEDELQLIPLQLSEKYRYIENAPVVMPLKDKNSVGVVGTKENLYQILKNMVIDLACRHYYNDLSFFFIMEESDQKQFEWIRFLPHVHNDALNMRNIVFNDASKNILFEYLYKELSRREAEKVSYPHIVVFAYADMGIKRHPISRYIEKGAEFGVHFIFFEEHEELLPERCASLIRLQDFMGEIADCSGKTETHKFLYEETDDATAEKIAFKLAPVFCEEVSLEGALTKNITMYEMMGILSAADIDLKSNWENSMIYKSMAAPLGVRSKNQIVSLDLHEKKHGPHGLVAGTTGSGKSEILQSYILSMATLFHPYEVGFVIIDFKGGGMVNQFKDLPHLIGSITNIDGREINRSLLSIKAELKKRQMYFAKYGVNHIDQYIKLFKKGETDVPIPHLILIVDEFAELKADQPDFMKELISAARIGRSLGVHLILATQKPSGVVDAQIWSNSRFKLCLKVANKEDSNEVIKTPLAAEIKEPGRAYLQVGNNEIFELFQSAYSGASSDSDDSKAKKTFSIDELDFSGRHTTIYTRKAEKKNEDAKTQLDAIVDYVAEYCEKEGIKRLPGICLPPLTERVVYDTSAAVHDAVDTIVPIGIYDDPNSQYQGVAKVNLSDGNLMIIGSSQYGKTNLLQTLIRGVLEQYTPKEVNLYILDFASMALKVFDPFNHVGGVVTASEDEKLKNYFRMMSSEIKRRKEIFSKMGITSFASYREAGRSDIPHIITIIDNFIGLKELYPDYEENIINICREGVSVGITMIFSSLQTNGIGYKYMSNFANRICLYCNQSDEYSSLFDRCRMQPKNVPGRGLISLDKNIYEYQTYLAFEGEKEIERVETIRQFVKEINGRYQDIRARRIPEVPQVLDEAYVKENYIPAPMPSYRVPVGIDYETVDFIGIDLERTTTIGITGKEKSGRTNLAHLFVDYLYNHVFDIPSELYVVDNYEKQLDFCSAYGITERYTMDLSELESILSSTEERLKDRLTIVQNEGIESLKDEPLIVIAIQNVDVYSADGISKNAVETYKRIIKNYKNMKICFLFTNVDNVAIAYGASEMLKQVKEYNILFAMENLSNVKVADINMQVAKQFKKPIELGDGYMINEKGVMKLKFIHKA